MKVYFEGGFGKNFGEVIGEVEDNGIKLYVVKIRNDGVAQGAPDDYLYWTKRKSECTAFIDAKDIKKIMAIHANDDFQAVLEHNLKQYLGFKAW